MAPISIAKLVSSSLQAIEKRYVELLQGPAKRYNLSYMPFDKTIKSESDDPFYGTLTVNHAFPGGGLAPSRVTPIQEARPFQLLSGTIKATFNTYRGLSTVEGETEKGIKVAPSALTGNTGK
jgi:Gly-Xaa carboxypeptidase